VYAGALLMATEMKISTARADKDELNSLLLFNANIKRLLTQDNLQCIPKIRLFPPMRCNFFESTGAIFSKMPFPIPPSAIDTARQKMQITLLRVCGHNN